MNHLRHLTLTLLIVFISQSRLPSQTWTNSGPQRKVIYAISMSPQDTSIIYAGSFGSGVYKSTDAGSAWTNLKTGLTNGYVRSMLALSDVTVFCGTNDGVFKTVDGATNWTLVLPTPFSVRSLAYDSKTGSLYAATFGSGLYKSTNQGASWSSITVRDTVVSQTMSHLWSIGIFGRDSLYVGGSLPDLTTGGALFRSLNGGSTWIQVQRGTHIGSSVHSIAISPNSPEVSLIIGTGTKGVYKSTNGGLTWLDINGGGTVHPLTDEHINSVGFTASYRYAGTDSIGRFVSRTLGDTSMGWIEGTGLPGSPSMVSSIIINPLNQSTIYVGTEGEGVYRSVNGGFNWSPRNSGMLGIAARVIKRNGNGQIILGSDFGDGLWISSDQGLSWNRSINLSTSNAITAIGITNSASTLYAGAYGTGVFKSLDGGVTWTVTDSTVLNHFVRTLSVHPSNLNLVYAGTGNGVYKTSDGGTTWQVINTGIPFSTSIRAMALDLGNPNNLYVGTDSFFMFKTTNAGANWTNVTSANGFLPQDVFIRVITIDYNNGSTLYAGSDSGRIYKSTNSGSTWVLYTKLPATHSVRCILIHPTDHKVFFASTFGEGIFMSADSGSHWRIINDGIIDQEIYTIEPDQSNPLTLYAGSGSHGVFRTAFNFASHTPVLSTIGNKAMFAGQLSHFMVSATDSDATIPSLSATNLPSGASFIDSLNGRGGFEWTPTLGQIGTHTVTIHASDGISVDSEQISIQVLDPSTSGFVSLPVQSKWNLVSVPLTVSNYSKLSVFPTSTSNAFAYQNGYSTQTILVNGTGYWLKFGSAQNVLITGLSRPQDSITVQAGWNIIGSIDSSVTTSNITSDPGGMIASSFFGYNNGYFVSNTIEPGKGYWVKVNQSGKLILTSGGAMPLTNLIQIVPTSELPPSPPEAVTSNGSEGVPLGKPEIFALKQNYPNPFNPITAIEYDLPSTAVVRLAIFDVLGRQVRELVRSEQEAGHHRVVWDASEFSSGVYFYRLEVYANFSPIFRETRALLLER